MKSTKYQEYKVKVCLFTNKQLAFSTLFHASLTRTDWCRSFPSACLRTGSCPISGQTRSDLSRKASRICWWSITSSPGTCKYLTIHRFFTCVCTCGIVIFGIDSGQVIVLSHSNKVFWLYIYICVCIYQYIYNIYILVELFFFFFYKEEKNRLKIKCVTLHKYFPCSFLCPRKRTSNESLDDVCHILLAWELVLGIFRLCFISGLQYIVITNISALPKVRYPTLCSKIVKFGMNVASDHIKDLETRQFFLVFWL